MEKPVKQAGDLEEATVAEDGGLRRECKEARDVVQLLDQQVKRIHRSQDSARMPIKVVELIIIVEIKGPARWPEVDSQGDE